MKSKFYLLLCTLIPVMLFVLALPASADWNPGQPNKWFQAPDETTSGIDIRVDGNSNLPRFIADDFVCTSTGPITGFHFWGSWADDVKGNIGKIYVSICSDIPDPDADGPLYGKPDQPIWYGEFTPNQFTERLYKELPKGDYEWWWDPLLGTLKENGDQKIYQYNIQIDPKIAFLQQGTAAKPIRYWVAIAAVLDPRIPAQFGWKTRDINQNIPGGGHFQENAVIGYQDQFGNQIRKLEYPNEHPYVQQSLDMAFVLTTVKLQPDLWVRSGSDASYFGDNIYSNSGVTQRRNLSVPRGSTANYLLRVQNDGAIPETFLLKAPAAPAGWTAKYFTTTNVDVTDAVNGDGWPTGELAVGASVGFYVKVTPSASLRPNSKLMLIPTVCSSIDDTKKDVGQLVTIATGMQPDLWVRSSSTDAIYYGDNIYSADGATQRRTASVPRGSTANYLLRVQNDGSAADTFIVKAAAAPAGWTAKYFTLTNVDITASVNGAAGWSTGAVAVGATVGLYVKVTPGTSLLPGATLMLKPVATSVTEGSRKDVGQLVTTATGMQPDLWVRGSGDASYFGDNIFSTSGVTQRRNAAIPHGATANFLLRVQNDGSAADTFALKASVAPAGWTVKYFTTTNVDITAAVNTATGWSTGVVAVGATVGFYVKVSPSASVIAGTTLILQPTAISLTDVTRKDVGQLSTTLVPYWNLGDPYKWLQMPDLNDTGMAIRVDGSDLHGTRIMADDFQCTRTGPITDIHFWGTWLDDVKGQISTLRLSIYTDIPANGQIASKPGTQLWTKNFTAEQITERSYPKPPPNPDDPNSPFEWWWDIPGNVLNVIDGNTKVYQYNVQINEQEAFVQQGSADKPIIYWLAVEVELVPSATATPQFGWKTRNTNPEEPGGGHYMDDAVYGSKDPNGVINWTELYYPYGHPNNPQSLDMAFVITTKSPQYQPDGWITYDYALPVYFGDNFYNLDGTNQSLDTAVVPGTTGKYFGIVQNDGNAADFFRVKGTAGKTDWLVKYFDTLTNTDITAQMTGAGWTLGPLAPGAKRGYRIEVSPSSAVGGGDSLLLTITTTSVRDTTKKDVVKVNNIT